MGHVRRSLIAVAVTALGAAAGAAAPAHAAETREVLLVGNNWDGTTDILDVPSYKRIDRIDVAPDREQRFAEMAMDPGGVLARNFIINFVGEGHDQLNDDVFSSHDGKTIYVSRPTFGDVVAIDLASRRIVWRTPLEATSMRRADHMAISPDGRRLAVSGQTLAGPQNVEVLDTQTGKIVGRFESGDAPHENNYSKDGKRIFHASIGRVWTDLDEPEMDDTKGNRVFEVVDAETLQVVKRVNMADKLAEFGRPGMSSAVRPMALSPDEKKAYLQISFFHGFVEYDLETDKVTRVADLPVPPEVAAMRRDEYILDSAHHGIAMSGDGKKLCVAGTMSNYAAIVHVDDFSHRIHPLGARTYWSTTSTDGKYCYVSVAGDDTMSIISYETEEEVARVPVGDHPQRARTGVVATSIFGAPDVVKARPRRLSLTTSPARDRRAPYRFRLAGRLTLPEGTSVESGCHGRVNLEILRGTRVVARGVTRVRSRGSSCAYRRTLAVSRRAVRGLRTGRLTARARFRGNESLLALRSRTVRLRVR